MVQELAVATGLVLICVLIHAGGLLTLAKMLKFELRSGKAPRSLRSRLGVSLVLILSLMALHGLEIWIYAIAFVGLDAVADLRSAVYFSTSTYAAIGFSDEAIAPNWALVGAIEGINGLLLIGWSTAFLVTVMGRLRR